MSGLRHYYEPGMVYYITTVTKNRLELFRQRAACQFLILCLQYHKFIFSYKIFGFVIMPEHLHFIIQPPPEISISQIMQHIKGNFAREYNLMRGEKGFVWQKRYYEKVIRGESHMREELDYMHNNPVRARLVTSPGMYEFSSYHYYYGNRYKDLIDRF